VTHAACGASGRLEGAGRPYSPSVIAMPNRRIGFRHMTQTSRAALACWQSSEILRGTVSEFRDGPVVDHETGDIKVKLTDRIVLITIDRPSKRNALTQAMYGTMADALLQADSDQGVGAVVLTGVNDVFTAGNDLADFASGGSLDQTLRFLDAIASVHVPLVAAVNGLGVGVGLTLLLHCDLVYIEPTADLSAPFVGLGLVPEAASSLLLPRIVGERRAADLILTGRHLSGSMAAEWGLANAAVSPVLESAMAAAKKLASQPPLACRASKALLRSEEQTIHGRMAEEMSAFRDALGGPEFASVIASRNARR
jgi:enoyl-CoA hydratase/carnithine racemase